MLQKDMEKIFNKLLLFNTLQSQSKFESEGNTSLIQNLLNFTTNIPNSKLLNVTVENLMPEEETEITNNAKEIKQYEKFTKPMKSNFSITPEPFSNLSAKNDLLLLNDSKSLEATTRNTLLEDSEILNKFQGIQKTESPNLFQTNVNFKNTSRVSSNLLNATISYIDKTTDVSTDISDITTKANDLKISFTNGLNSKYNTKAFNYSTNYYLSSNINNAQVFTTNISQPYINIARDNYGTKLLDAANESFQMAHNTTNSSKKLPTVSMVPEQFREKPMNDKMLPNASSISSRKIRKMTKKVQQVDLSSKVLIYAPETNASINITNETYAHDSEMNSKNPFLIKKPGSGFTKFEFSSSMVLSIGIACALSLLLFVILSLWFLKRKADHHKVYLNYKVNKPCIQVNPMKPIYLPSETLMDDVALDELENLRKPIYLEQEINLNTAPVYPKYTISLENCDSGVDNLAFDNLSSEGCQTLMTDKIRKKKENSQSYKPILKYIAKKKKLPIDSLKVCSSDGSIFPVSPSLTKCLIPPPPYSPRMKSNSKLTLSSPSNDNSETNETKLSINSISEGCDNNSSQCSNF